MKLVKCWCYQTNSWYYQTSKYGWYYQTSNMVGAIKHPTMFGTTKHPNMGAIKQWCCYQAFKFGMLSNILVRYHPTQIVNHKHPGKNAGARTGVNGKKVLLNTYHRPRHGQRRGKTTHEQP